jgi:hypothetical protein
MQTGQLHHVGLARFDVMHRLEVVRSQASSFCTYQHALPAAPTRICTRYTRHCDMSQP